LTIFGITLQNSLADALCIFIGRPFNIRLMYRRDPGELAAARAELVRYGERLLADGLSVGSAGNLSVRVGDAVAITPSGVAYREMTPAGIFLVTLAGAQVAGDDAGDDAGPLETPSSETPMHLAIYAATGAAATVHTHSPEVLSSAELYEVRAESRRRRYGTRDAKDTALVTRQPRETPRGPLGQVTVLGAHILDVLGRPVEAIPPGQGSARLTEIRATAAGTAAGPGVDLAKLGASVLAVGAVGDDLGAPDALGGIVGDGLAQVVTAARAGGALVAVDVLHPGRPQDLELIAGLLGAADWFLPNDDQLLALTGRDDLTSAIEDVLALGVGGVAVTCGADGCVIAWRGGGPVSVPAIKVDVVDTTGCGDGFTAGMLAGLLVCAGPVDAAWLGIACGSLVATGLGSDAGIDSLGQVLDFLGRTQPAVADRIAAAAARRAPASEGANP
jgi:sugar/nucleoside kinase (ribokinase family)